MTAYKDREKGLSFIAKEKERPLRIATAQRYLLLAETLARSVYQAADLTRDLFRRVGIRLDGLRRKLVTSDDVTDLRELNMVLLGHLEDNFSVGEFAALVDDQACQFTGFHAEMIASQSHHDFSRTLAEEGDLAKNGFLLLRKLSGLFSLEFLLELLDGFAFDVKALRIICIISDDILVCVCVFCRNAGTFNRAVKRNELEVVRGKLSEAVVHHIVADRITVVLLLLDRLTENEVEFLDDLDNAVSLNLVPRGRATDLEHIDLSSVTEKDFAFGVLAAGLRKKGEVAEFRQCEPELGVEKLIGHQSGLGGDTHLVDSVQDVDESGASSLFHEWNLPSAFF